MITVRTAALPLLLSVFAAAADAQEAAPVAPPAVFTAQPVAAQQGQMMTVPANLAVTVRMNSELNTSRNREGETFYATVANDVVHNGFVVIPRGSRAVGTITWLTKKGMFGKSGKMDISIDTIEIGSNRIATVGTFRQEGEGNTVATVGAVIVAPVIGFFVTGRSGVIPSGRELEVHTRDPFDVAIAAAAPAPVPVAAPVAPATAAPVAPAAASEPAQPSAG